MPKPVTSRLLLVAKLDLSICHPTKNVVATKKLLENERRPPGGPPVLRETTIISYDLT